MTQTQGMLIIIGGREQKEPGDQCLILHEVARLARTLSGTLLIATVATDYPEIVSHVYGSTFDRLGVPAIDVLDIRHRDHSYDPANIARVNNAAVIFITGGDQWRLMERIAGTPVLEALYGRYAAGAVIAGTSAGAVAMSPTMIVSGYSGQSYLHDTLEVAEGLGLLPGCVVESHFSQRGRLGRLLGAVAREPQALGIGIDENTAMIVSASEFSVLGSGAVYVVDGQDLALGAGASGPPYQAVGMQHVRLHVLAMGDSFDLARREPLKVWDNTSVP